MAEVLLDALSQVTGSRERLSATTPPASGPCNCPTSASNSYFLKTFGRPLRAITCECERTAEPSMVQVLHISNGDTINQKLAAKGNRLEADAGRATRSNDAIIEEAYLAALSRFPTDEERQEAARRLSTRRRPTSAARRSKICIGASSAAKNSCSIINVPGSR